METRVGIPSVPPPPWRSYEIFTSSKTLFAKPSSRLLKPQIICKLLSNENNHTTLLVESYHRHQRLKALLLRLNHNTSFPLQLLREDGDWSKDQFWAVATFLKRASRSKEILPVFDEWKMIEESRNNEFNYERIIGLLCGEGLMEEAVSALSEMNKYGLNPTFQIHNSIIHGFANQGKFSDALLFLERMKEMNFSPDTDTYDGLIAAYGSFGMYDEISRCLKRMEVEGCWPDHFTCNLLIQVFSRGGLLQKMESVYQRMISKRMDIQPSSLVAMLEGYANFGILGKMENIYKRLKTPLKDDLVRKLGKVYIENHMYSRLDDLGRDLSSTRDLGWCLRLLSYACLLSRKGMESTCRQMEEAGFPWNVTLVNILLLAYMKMKDTKQMTVLLSQLASREVEPDIMTVGIVFDAGRVGFEGSTRIVDIWTKMGLLSRKAEMNTDPLVVTAFGKGEFLRGCENAYSSFDPKDRELKKWTYANLIDLVSLDSS